MRRFISFMNYPMGAVTPTGAERGSARPDHGPHTGRVVPRYPRCQNEQARLMERRPGSMVGCQNGAELFQLVGSGSNPAAPTTLFEREQAKAMIARIYKPAKTAMQSATAKTQESVLHYDPEQPPQ